MPYTDENIYYPDGNTLVSLAEISENVAESINERLTVVQVAYGSSKQIVTNSSGTVYANSSLSAKISPISESNGILAIVRMPFESSATFTGLTSQTFWSGADFKLRRGSVDIFDSSPGIHNFRIFPNNSPMLFGSSLNITYVDLPNTKQELEYTVFGKPWGDSFSPAATAKSLSMNFAEGAALSVIMLMEVSF